MSFTKTFEWNWIEEIDSEEFDTIIEIKRTTTFEVELFLEKQFPSFSKLTYKTEVNSFLSSDDIPDYVIEEAYEKFLQTLDDWN